MPRKTKNARKASKLEVFVDNLIPYAIILIIAITVVEMVFASWAQKYFLIIDLIDLFILFVFFLDLLFKFIHSKSIPDFVKRYWLYIIALFPFFLVFRVIERFYHISTISPSSTIVLGRYFASLLSESRLVRILYIFRVLTVSSRLARALYFYEDPKVRHKIKAIKFLKLK